MKAYKNKLNKVCFLYKKSYLRIIYSLFFFCIFLSSYLSHDAFSHEASEIDQLNYDLIIEKGEGEISTGYLFEDKDRLEHRNHYYGYGDLSYVFENNPAHAPGEGSSKKKDSYLYGKLYLLHAFEITEHSALITSLDSYGKFYNTKEELNEDLTNFEIGPAFYSHTLRMKTSPRIFYSIARDDSKSYYYSRGGILKIEFLEPFENFEPIISYKYEDRNYKRKNTNLSNREVHYLNLNAKYKLTSNNVFRFIPIYQKHNTDVKNVQKEIYGLLLYYTYYFPKGYYAGSGYEYFLSRFKHLRTEDNERREDTENAFGIFLGRNFTDSIALRFSYYREKEYSNLGLIETSYNDSFRLSFRYNFHLHGEPEEDLIDEFEPKD